MDRSQSPKERLRDLARKFQPDTNLKHCKYPEERCRGPSLQAPVFDRTLLGEVVRGLDRGHHSLHGQEGSQVGSVGGDHDEGEEPPHAGHHAGGHGPWEMSSVRQYVETDVCPGSMNHHLGNKSVPC